ncbi:hypothetical protein E6O75_ATG01575 [Venturia nashicola]|uniref:Uncharacterized protein n=1 Tax=Venturia nashicola TaxID=86259 RepID=A0A4Z1PCJ1_9PEZI|nr:hypothetical protein E6O75_ATG01575 [Venturia nashicola]
MTLDILGRSLPNRTTFFLAYAFILIVFLIWLSNATERAEYLSVRLETTAVPHAGFSRAILVQEPATKLANRICAGNGNSL